MIIRLKDGSEKEYAQPMSVLDIAKDISEGLARNACAGQVNGETYSVSCTCTGSKAFVSRGKACNWTGNRRRFLL